MIYFAKPVLTEDLCVVQKEEIFNNMLYVRKVHLTKGHANSLETNPSFFHIHIIYLTAIGF
jgi:hypothetical protein